MSAAAIRADGLSKFFGPVVAVDELSFEVAEGSIYGFLGPNGAGKTTTIRLLLDLLRPSRGGAAVLGFDCHRASRETRRRIGYLPGELPIYPDLSASGYLDYLSRLGGRPIVPSRLSALLRRFDVSDVDLRRPLRDQSHGMKRKIGIVQALMTAPPVVIMDEPTAGLDPLMVEAFRETLAELGSAGETTVFLSSHVLAEVEATCDRIGLVKGGRMITSGTIADLRLAAARRVIVEFASPVAAVALPPEVTSIAIDPCRWEVDVRGPMGPLLAALQGRPVLDLRVEPFSLEQHVMPFYATTSH